MRIDITLCEIGMISFIYHPIQVMFDQYAYTLFTFVCTGVYGFMFTHYYAASPGPSYLNDSQDANLQFFNLASCHGWNIDLT